jgi:hypothetical protein
MDNPRTKHQIIRAGGMGNNYYNLISFRSTPDPIKRANVPYGFGRSPGLKAAFGQGWVQPSRSYRSVAGARWLRISWGSWKILLRQ